MHDDCVYPTAYELYPPYVPRCDLALRVQTRRRDRLMEDERRHERKLMSQLNGYNRRHNMRKR
jgi:hypothetical protein